MSDRLTPRFLVIPGLLVLIYGMLSVISFFDQDGFYSSMDIPVPANEFLIWSWAGKNTAMLTILVIALVTRLRVMVYASLAMLLVGQAGDINAGAQSGTNVFITWIAFGLVVVQIGLLWWERQQQLEG